ncbi:MAG: metallophosphoesterase, partial [Candidatus Acidiferrales bacterium]
KEIRRVVGLARELEPDLTFHTGDFLTGRSDPLPQAVAELARAEGRYGSFGCLGNHEIYAGAQDKATELFARQGVRILRGQNVELEIRGAKLNLIGVDYQRQPRGRDPVRWRSYFVRGVETLVRPNVTNILLSHNPNSFVRAAELGIQLTLAGHTHGGQVQVEILDSRWSPARFMTPFVSGLFQRPSGVSPGQQSFLYVSRGIGTVGVPVRLNAPPEITLLTLRRG